MQHAIDGNWDTPTLQRNTNTLYLGRILEVPKNNKTEPQNLINEISDPEQKNEFKSLIQSYVRLYEYISQIITFVDIELEKLFIFLKYVNKKLPKGDPGFVDISGSVELSSLRNVMTGDNSETNKRRKFEEVIGSIFLSYVNDRVDFNQKFENPVIRV